MTTPQSITPDDIALGIAQLGAIHQILTGVERATAQADSFPPVVVVGVARGLVRGLDDILAVTDGVSLPTAALDEAIGTLRQARTEIAQIAENASILTAETLRERARDLANRIGEVIRASMPYASGGNPQNSTHRQVDFGPGGLTFPQVEPPTSNEPEIDLGWLTGQAEGGSETGEPSN